MIRRDPSTVEPFLSVRARNPSKRENAGRFPSTSFSRPGKLEQLNLVGFNLRRHILERSWTVVRSLEEINLCLRWAFSHHKTLNETSHQTQTFIIPALLSEVDYDPRKGISDTQHRRRSNICVDKVFAPTLLKTRFDIRILPPAPYHLSVFV